MAIIETIPFNFDELYAGLEAKFIEAGLDTSQGSNTSQLITAMAYFTSMLNVNTAINVNETLLPLASKRDNVLSDARAIGYEIRHKQSYSYDLELTLTGAATYTIPKYSEFVEGGKSFYYMGSQIDVVGDAVINISVIEGKLFKYADFPDSLSVTTTTVVNETGQSVPQSYIVIPFTDIEENGIECFLTYYDIFGSHVVDEEWTKTNQIVNDADAQLQKNFIRIDDISFKTPRIYFEIANVGAGIKVGTTVNMNVLQSSGSLGAMVDITKPLGVKHTILNCVIGKITLLTQGAEEETIESIKSNAPKFFNSANRAVTASDYVAICNRQSSVKDSLVWGGDEELPKSPGHVWFSFLPSNTERIFTNDTFNSNYILNNSIYSDWDYSISDANNPVEFQAQLDNANNYYTIRYVEDSEIVSTDLSANGVLTQQGIWDVLQPLKIPTLEFHNRHPIFLDFEFDIEILKYNIVTSKADIFQNVFNSIDGFFNGVGDVVTTEKFKSEYLHSTLQKRIDGVLTDSAGFTSTLNTKILLSSKNISSENSSTDYRDIFIPLAMPLNKIFDANGFLLYDVLPNIDTPAFIDYRPVGSSLIAPTTTIRTDWSNIQAAIDSGTSQEFNKLIVAPIIVDLEETITITSASNIVTLVDISVYPDDPTTLGDVNTPDSYNKTVVSVNGVIDTGWVMTTPTTITFSFNLNIGDIVHIRTEGVAGSYMIVNGVKKYITIQLYVDGAGYSTTQSASVVYDTQKSYLTTTDGLYDYTTDNFYLTTNGYSTTDLTTTTITGAVVKKITPATYFASPLKMDLFRRDRQLNMKYKSNNFLLERNVVPRLKRVTFK